uniref:MHC class II antigen beta chain n=1 Tax=Andrias davidianus TaxID=141262 RepID=U5QB38_ANDDA|nr:MHC class II antigen beta chain [Andrias davidianus]
MRPPLNPSAWKWCAGAGTVLLALLTLHGGHCGTAPADFVTQAKAECHFLNGSERVRFLLRYFYNQEELAYFDSDVGRFVPKTEFGKPDADYWNSDPAILEDARAAVERYCKHNYDVRKQDAKSWKVIPKVRITPTKTMSLDHQTMLVCYVEDFYPPAINISWIKNGKEETGSVMSTEMLQNGDWTYQIHLFLGTTPERGDTYVCQVEHSSLKSPITVEWKPDSSESAKSKRLTGIVGFVLGAIFITLGLIIYLKNKKGTPRIPVPQNDVA